MLRWVRGIDPVRLGVLMLLIASNSRIQTQIAFLEAMRPALLGFALSVGWACLDPRSVRTGNLVATWHVKAYAVLLVCMMGSVAFGISNGSSGSYVLTQYWKVLLEFLLILVAIRNTRDLRVLCGTYVLIGAVWVWVVPDVFADEFAPSGYGYDRNDVCVILLMSFVLTLVWMQTRRAFGRVLPVLLLGGIVFAIVTTQSRGGLVALGATGAVLLVGWREIAAWKRLSAVLVAAVALLAFAPEGYWDRISTIFNPSEDYNTTSVDGRIPLWTRGIGYMVQYPVFGLGVNNFGRAEATLSNKDWVVGNAVKWSQPHNTSIQVGAELGIPALLVWWSILAAGFFGSWKLARRLPSWWKRSDRDRRFLYHLSQLMPAMFVAYTSSTFFLSFLYLAPTYFLLALLALHRILVRRTLREDRARWHAWAAAQAAPEPAVPPAGGWERSRRNGHPTAQPLPAHASGG